MALVCVTGGSGYLGSQVVKELIDQGHQVRATTRNPERLDPSLTQLGVEWFAADLLAPESLQAPIASCDYVVHTASPYVLTVSDPERDLVDPAVSGTRSVLQAAADSGSVERVVLTSSFAAVTDEPEGTFTEADWNTRSSLTRNPYYFSKVEAEKAAWNFVDGHEKFDLVVINPSVIIGPSLIPSLNESSRALVGLLKGLFPAVLDLCYAFVDVRDVAKAHRLAMEKPEASGRYLCTAETWSQRRLVSWLKQANLGLGKPPRFHLDNKVGNGLVRLMARFQSSGERDYLLTNLGRCPDVDTTKVRTELGLRFRPLAETLIDAYRDLTKWGHL